MSINNESRERLIECAKKEFLEKGFAKASLRNICAEAGLTTGAVYFLFKDKNGLLGAIVDEPLQRIQEMMLYHFSAEQKEDFSTYQQRDGDHDQFAKELIDVMYDNYDAMRILLDKSQGSAYESIVDRFIETTDKYYIELAQNYADSVTGKRVNQYMLHWFSHIQIQAFVHLLTHESDRQKALQSIRTVIDFLVKGWMMYILEDDK
ncbi:MAG: TetR/AcrR family transcriptional regulator [Ruminococcus sp.]|nr:TetR/AcrR family transcriptional regulator [Ruminococcus sp.]MBR2305316.1 TetR/AcrR family transcriptional regulator [Ruminococcus sp.]